jgi:outer membrane protein assembly factor BamA
VTYATGAYVVYEIDAGEVFKIRDVKVIGASEKDAVITISKGDEALGSRIESARQILAENLERHGKKHTVTVSIERDIANHVVDITLTTN